MTSVKFIYKTDNGSSYSRFFYTKEEALAWFNIHGKFFEKSMNRKLNLIEQKIYKSKRRNQNKINYD